MKPRQFALTSCRYILSYMTAVAAIVMIPGAAQSAGFYLQGQSVSALGTAYAGAVTMAEDASTIYFNPAGMTFLHGVNMTVSADVIDPKAKFTDIGSEFPAGTDTGPSSDDPVDTHAAPNFYTAMPVYNDDLWVGVGVSAPFGMSSNFDPQWFGRYDGIDSELTTIDIQPAIAYRFNSWLSAGAGLNIQYAKAKLSNAVFDGQEGRSELTGDDITLGWNAGIMITPHDKTRIGIHYRAAIDHDIKGRVRVSGTAMSDEDSKASAALNLPDIFTAGIRQQITDRLALYGQITWYGWQNFEDITVIRADGSQARQIDENFKNTLNYAAGLSYDYSPRLTLRAGYQYDPTPTRDDTRHASIADQNRHWITTGGSYRLSEHYTLDAGAAYISMGSAPIDITRNGGLARINIRKERSHIGIVALGISARF